jgi:hypothetical protein
MNGSTFSGVTNSLLQTQSPDINKTAISGLQQQQRVLETAQTSIINKQAIIQNNQTVLQASQTDTQNQLEDTLNSLILVDEGPLLPITNANVDSTFFSVYELPLLSPGLYLIYAQIRAKVFGGTTSGRRFEIASREQFDYGISFKYKTYTTSADSFLGTELLLEVTTTQTVNYHVMLGIHFATCTSATGQAKVRIVKL